ncbi:hypothetical protein OHB41_05380 [Streptomyces sp. NBC_01571]|uniref:hypothetical protein n=1 Tax=Streptomyces sp. NBC_01571 TaxID=2975883 RepID=UPI00224D25EC|nr:hypothetical protein [Streptomyces sp. NBC_01571]MCX4572624.1 hypothetical protein [Streptomyces sp. NBC_01571]
MGEEGRLGEALAHRPRDVCARHGTVLPHAAVRFPLRDLVVAGVVAGFRSSDEVTSAAAWAATDLTDAAWADLDAAAEAPGDGFR